jgi:hypothetical protein
LVTLVIWCYLPSIFQIQLKRSNEWQRHPPLEHLLCRSVRNWDFPLFANRFSRGRGLKHLWDIRKRFWGDFEQGLTILPRSAEFHRFCSSRVIASVMVQNELNKGIWLV